MSPADPATPPTGSTAATGVSSFRLDEWTPERLLDAKGDLTVSMCFPCRDEAATIGPLAAAVRQELVERVPLLDELIVLDDRSTDDTPAVAASAGATVVPIETVHSRHGIGHGKGNALWASLVASRGDIVVWCDGDVTSFTPDWVVRLVAPFVLQPDLALVKAMYQRPSASGGGGRTTELVARPLLSLFAPELVPLMQPLSGEFAGRRASLVQIPFVEGWGVEIAMLLDLVERFGPGAVAQVDLGVRQHRHRSLHSLSVQAAEVMATALTRLGMKPTVTPETLTRADGSMVPLNLAERPPLADLPEPGHIASDDLDPS